MRYKVGLGQTKRKSGPKTRKLPNSIKGLSGLNFVKYKRVTKYTKERAKGGRKPTKFKTAVKRVLFIFLGFLFFLGMLAVVGFAIYLKNVEASLPDPNRLVERDSQLSTQIFDRNGKLLYTVYGDENREFIKLEDIPEHAKWALLAAEDSGFYEHKGLDLVGIARAGLQYFGIIPGSSGASTITQQLVRNTVLKDTLGQEVYERSIIRKIKEMLLTMQIEQSLSKDEILQLYMNEVFMGGVNYGYQSASKAYFGKDARKLTVAESALLAGIIQAPGAYNPINGLYPEMAEVRQEYVLDQMLKHSRLTGVTEEEVQAAKDEKLEYKSANINILAPHFVFYVKDILEKEFGPDKVVHGGLKVTTTLDYSAQKIAQEEVKNAVKQHGAQYGVKNGAMVAIDPKTGDIIAMVGSIDYNSKNPKIDGNVNVTIAPRQMGSSVKPYTYLTAFGQYGPWLITPDIKGMNFGNYKLVNWDERYYGLMVARQALVQSRNIPAVYTAQLIGIDNFIKTAETFGITTLTDRSKYGLSITLGAAEMKLLEHTAAYTVFANGGVKRDPRAILKVTDSSGNILLENKDNPGKRVWNEKEVYMLNWALCDLGGFGDQPSNQLYLLDGKRTFCGKTGTTDGPKDLTSMMYTRGLVVGSWAGNNDNTPTPGAWSTTVPIYTSSNFMKRMAGKYKPEPFIRPSGISSAVVCNDTGDLAGKDNPCKKVQTIYINGKEPKKDDREAIYVCKSNGKASTNVSFSKLYSLGSTKYLIKKELENELQKDKYLAFLKAINSSYIFVRPESGECELPAGEDGTPSIQIATPSNNETIYPGSELLISIGANAYGGVQKVEVMFDGGLIKTFNSGPYSFTYNVPPSTSVGAHSIVAIAYAKNGKTANSTISVQATSSASLNMNLPTSGATNPALFQVTGTTSFNQVTFYVAGPGSYSKSFNATGGPITWTATFNPSALTNGAYTVYARGQKGSSFVNSASVSFNVSN